MNDVRRLNDLRAEARASYYNCRRAISFVNDTGLRDALERGAFARWRLARSIDAFLSSQPAPDRSRLEPTLRDVVNGLVLQLRAALATDRNLEALHWLASDSKDLRRAVEWCRSLTGSLEVSDFLGTRLAELKQVQRAAAGLGTTTDANAGTATRGAGAGSGSRTLATT